MTPLSSALKFILNARRKISSSMVDDGAANKISRILEEAFEKAYAPVARRYDEA